MDPERWRKIERIYNAALEFAAPTAADEPSSVGPSSLDGRELSHYRIAELIGRGGMGEVYRAGDTRLRR